MPRFLLPPGFCFPMLHCDILCPSLCDLSSGWSSIIVISISKGNGPASSRTHISTPSHPDEKWQPLLITLSKVCRNSSPRDPGHTPLHISSIQTGSHPHKEKSQQGSRGAFWSQSPLRFPKRGGGNAKMKSACCHQGERGKGGFLENKK